MKNLLSRTKSGRRKGSLGLVLDSDERDAAEEVASTNGTATAPAPADAVDDATGTADPAPAVVDDATAIGVIFI